MLQKLTQLLNPNRTAQHKKSNYVPVKLKDVEKRYAQHPSFANFAPWMEYDHKSQCFLLEDGRSVALGFELEGVSCEARSPEFLLELRDKFQRLFQDTVPQEQDSPWVLQFYLQDERSLINQVNLLADYVKPEIKDAQHTQAYLQLFSEHCRYMMREKGLFMDNEVSGLVFYGKTRFVRVILYRRLTATARVRRGRTAIQDANAVAKNVMNQLQSAGVKIKRMSGKTFYEWMMRWFNPHPAFTRGDTDALLQQRPFPREEELPFGYDFAEQVFCSTPQSDEKQGVWFFDGEPHKFITIQGMSTIPAVGHVSAEREQGKKWYVLFDKFPLGSVFVLTVVIEDQNTVKQHIKEIIESAVGDDAEANLARLDCTRALYEIEQSNYLYPTVMGVYVRAKNIDELLDYEIEVESTLNNSGLNPIRGDVDLTPLDAYLRYLPMCYDHRFDKKYSSRSRYVYARQIANLMPLYGRYRGSGHPGLTRFNRGGEPLYFDPFSRQDKSFNSHTIYFGGTGSGKSSALVGDLMQIMAVYRPRLFIIEAGNSFGLLADYFKTQGLSVHKVRLKRSQPVALNPFASGLAWFEQYDAASQQALQRKIGEEEEVIEQTLATLKEAADEDELNAENEERDVLGEMALAAQLMITGGERKEEEKITRQDRLWILNALFAAANIAKEISAPQLLAEHIVTAMRRMADTIDAAQSASSVQQAMRLREMADCMDLFCKDDLSSKFFNTPGNPWPTVDVTVLDMGMFAAKGYETQLSLAVMGVLNRVAAIAEANQYQGRPTLLVTDESHVITKNPLTAAQYVFTSKTSRKLGLWLWFATQNMADFPDEAQKMLSMIEFWLIMGTTENEIVQIQKFKPMSHEQHNLLLSIRKELGKYTEGVVLSSKINGLFRNIPPRLAFALAQTELDEKTARKQLMKQFSISELAAAEKIAEQMLQTEWS